MKNSLWYEKYRPRDLDSFVWVNDAYREQFDYWMKNPSEFPHIILEGKPGTGKTTLAFIMARAIVEDEYDLLYINTNKNAGVNTIREDVTNFCEVGGFSTLKVVIIDEADGLTAQAMDKLRGVINDYGSFVRFIFTCNRIQSFSSTSGTALKSRARVMKFDTLDEEQYLQKLIEILEKENVEYKFDDAADIFDLAYPDLRKGIDLLQNCTRDKVLYAIDSVEVNKNELQESVDLLMKDEHTSPTTIRAFATSLSDEQILEVFRHLYDQSDSYFPNVDEERKALIAIAKYMSRHNTVAFPDINLCGLMNELIE